MKTRNKILNGFTTIELLIVILIMGLMFGVGLSSYNEFNKNQIIGQTAKEIKNYLRLVQQKSMSGEMDCSAGVCSNGGICTPADSKPFKGWSVSVAGDNISYWGTCGTTNYSSRTFEIPNTLTLSPTSAPANPITFTPSPGGNSGATICISGYSKIYKISLVSSGEIIDNGFVGACP